MRDQMLTANREIMGGGDGNRGVEFTTYTVHIPVTPDNQPSAAEISLTSPSFRQRADDDQQQQQVSGSLFTGGHNRATRARPNSISLQEDHPQTTGAAGEFVDAEWLFEGRGSYGYGNAMWARDEEGGEDGGDDDRKAFEEEEKWRPLTRKTSISAAILFPYRVLILVRMVALGLFLQWRLVNPNDDAMWLWGMSVACECWFAFSWLLDQLPKLRPIDHSPDTAALRHNFPQQPSGTRTRGNSSSRGLPGIDVFVSTADPEKEPPLVTANTILSILAADYPADSLACYLSDDGGSLLTFEAAAEAASFAALWVPFCRKHDIEPRNPEAYFGARRADPYRNKVLPDFVRDRRKVKREYDEFKVRVNALTDSIRRRSDAYNTKEEIRAMKLRRERAAREDDDYDGVDVESNVKVVKATWMADGTHWPGTWTVPAPEHSRGDHASIIQVMIKPSRGGTSSTEEERSSADMLEAKARLPMLVYISREKRPGYDHNKKAGAMNALVRASAVMSNGPFILNLDCDHYVNNSEAIRQGMCFMLDPADGPRIAYVQFPQRFEGIDPSDRYANRNTVFFDVNMRALDGLQGPFYVGTGCLFRRTALYGFRPSNPPSGGSLYDRLFVRLKPFVPKYASEGEDDEEEALMMSASLVPKKRFGNSAMLLDAIRGWTPQGPLEVAAVAEAVGVVSSWYEDKTEWGHGVGWIYGSVTEDVVTGYHMHDRGWRSVYCVTTKRDAFRGTAPINLTDRLHQVLRWATGSVEIFFSRNNAVLASSRLNPLQRIAYLNVGIYPFTSVFLLVYCFLPALSLFSGQFIVQSLSPNFLVYLLGITLTLIALAALEVKWSGIGLEDWWRNEQFWLIGGTSAHLAAVLQGLLKVVAGIDISFTLTSKSAADDGEDEFAELYEFKWTALMVPPVAIMMTNVIAISVAVFRTIYSETPEWSNLLGGVFFSLWVLMHLYPFAKGLMGRRGRTPTVVFVWSGLVAITISLLWVAINPPSNTDQIGGSFQFP